MDGFGKVALPAERETGLGCANKRECTSQLCDLSADGAEPFTLEGWKRDVSRTPIIAGCLAGLAFLALLALMQRKAPDLLVSQPCTPTQTCQHTWSLTSRLGDIITYYESRIGQRAPALRLLGIEFTAAQHPAIWFPDYGDGHKSVIVQLTKQARFHRELALFQLGHEAFHLIAPTPNLRTTYWEEGLASYFALAYLAQRNLPDGRSHLTGKNYQLAHDLTAELARLHRGSFDRRLKALRHRQPSFSRVTTEQLGTAFPKAPANLIRQLVAKFPALSADRSKP